MPGVSRSEKMVAAEIWPRQCDQGVASLRPQARRGGARRDGGGLDPAFEKPKVRGVPTFKQAAARVYAAIRQHARQWKPALDRFAYPTLGAMSVAEITGPMVGNLLADQAGDSAKGAPAH
jgi:hypothetical protein